MIRFTESEANTIGADCKKLEIRAIAERVYQTFAEISPQVIANKSFSECIHTIESAISAAIQYGIVDFDDHCNWSYIRLCSGVDFYKMAQFRSFLDDPLFHPKSKARNIVTSFIAAAKGEV